MYKINLSEILFHYLTQQKRPTEKGTLRNDYRRNFSPASFLYNIRKRLDSINKIKTSPNYSNQAECLPKHIFTLSLTFQNAASEFNNEKKKEIG